jgi:predicted amidohydrolase
MINGKLQVCILQMDIQIGQPDENYQRVSDQLNKAMSGTVKPDVIQAMR